MTEESADSVSEPEGGDVFNMEGAVDTISDGLFPQDASVDVEEEVDLGEEEATEEKESIETKPDEIEQEIKEEIEKMDLPSSWKKDMEERWGKLDKETQTYVLQREDQMREGLEKDRGDANLGRTMRDMIKPYEAMLGARGIEAPQAVQYLLQNHQRLSEGTQEQKINLLNQLAKSYGIGVKKGETSPEVESLSQRLQTMEQNLNASHQRTLQETKTRIEGEVNDFAKDHPHFDELSDEIAKFISIGDGLEEAYNKAVRLSDGAQEKDFDKRVEEKLALLKEQEKQEAAEAKKAKSVNVRGRDTNKAPTAKLGTMEDTMREVFKKRQSQN